MNYLGSTVHHAEWYDGDGRRKCTRFEIRFHEHGGTPLLEVELREEHTGVRLGSWLVPLSSSTPSMPGVLVESTKTPPVNYAEDVKRLMQEALRECEPEYKRSDGGLFIPSVKPGDVVLVDKPGARDVKVYDAAEHAYERVPKVELEVRGKKVCTCPMRDILVGGCKCGGV